MTISKFPKTWDAPKPTRYNLDCAELTKIDISKYDKPNGKFELAKELSHAVRTDGFWALVGGGISDEEVHRHLALGKCFFEEYSLEQKKAQEVDFSNGNYFGYKAKGNRTLFDTDIRDNIEILNIPKFTEDKKFEQYFKQDFISLYRDELEAFSKKAFEIARKLFVLFAIILEVDEDYFVGQHLYNDFSDDHVRYMKYHPRSEEDDSKVENIWSRAHTDFGSLTLLFNQAVFGLQIRTSDGSWKYIPPVENGIVCNIGDTLSFWSGGYFKSTIHRVIRPPPDQVDSPRIGVFYFVRPGDNATVEVVDSPLLKRLGIYREVEPLKGTDYVRGRVKDYHFRSKYLKQENAHFKMGGFVIQDGFK